MQAEKIIVKNAKPERKYFKTYYDFLYNKILNGDEKFTFIILKSFLDFSTDIGGTKGEVFPTIKTICKITKWGNKKVIRVINNLVDKGVVKRIQRGLNKPNLYILSDYAAVWAAENIKDVKEIVENNGEKPMTAEEHIAELKKLGYDVEVKKVKKTVPEETGAKKDEITYEAEIVTTGETISENREIMPNDGETMSKNREITPNDGEIMSKQEELIVSENAGIKEKGPTSVPTKATDVDTQIKKLSNSDNTMPATKSQVPEKYSLEQIKQIFNYDFMISDNLIYNENIDAVMSIIHDNVNTTKETIRVNGEDKPAMVVIARLMKLDSDNIMYVINKFLEQTARIINPKSYMLTLLFNAKEQCLLDMQNEAKYDLTHR